MTQNAATTSPAPAGDVAGAVTLADIQATERVLDVVWGRVREFHRRVIRTSPTWHWHQGQSGEDFDGLSSVAGSTLYITGRDGQGDYVSCDMPFEYVTATDEEFSQLCARAEELNAEATKAARWEAEQQVLAQNAEAAAAKQAERDRIFREEAARRGIEVPE